MINLPVFAQMLQDAGIGEMGKTIFTNALPANISRALMLKTGIMTQKIDHELPGYYEAQFQVIARATKRQEAFDMALAAGRALKMGRVSPSPDMRVNYCRPQNLPITFPASDGKLFEASINFDISYTSDPV